MSLFRYFRLNNPKMAGIVDDVWRLIVGLLNDRGLCSFARTSRKMWRLVGNHAHYQTSAVRRLTRRYGGSVDAACRRGYFQMVQAICQKEHIRPTCNALSLAFEFGHLPIVEWGFPLLLHWEQQQYFNCPRKLNPAFLEWMWVNNPSDPYEFRQNNDLLFRELARTGQLARAKFLYSLDSQIVFRFDNHCAFIRACEHGHLAMAQWLYSLDESINLRCLNNYAFSCSLDNGHAEVCQWLFSLDPSLLVPDSHDFVWACQADHLGVVIWLWQFEFEFSQQYFLYKHLDHILAKCPRVLRWISQQEFSLSPHQRQLIQRKLQS